MGRYPWSMSASRSARLSTPVLVSFGCVYFFWGSTYVAMRYGVEVLNPFVLAATRFLIAGPLMLAICAMRGQRIWQGWRELGLLAVIGALMLGVGNTGVLWSEQYLPSGLAALLVAVIPLYVALIEAVLPQGEGLAAKGWVGIGVGFVGLAVLLSPGLREGVHGPGRLLVASGVALLAALAWTVASVIARHSRLKTDPFVAAAWQMLFGGMLSFFVMLGTGSQHGVRWTAQGEWSVAWLVVFGSLVGYTAYVYLLEHVPVAKVSTYAYINPIVAVVLGALFLRERLVPIEYVGMAAITLAVYLVTSSKLKSVKDGATLPEAEVEAIG